MLPSLLALCVFVSSYMSYITAYVFASRPPPSLFLFFCVSLLFSVVSTLSIFPVTGHIQLSISYNPFRPYHLCNFTVTQAPASASEFQETKTSLGNNLHTVTSIFLTSCCLTNQIGVCHKQTENAALS